MTLPISVKPFVRWIYSVPDTPEASRTMILSSYSTLQIRELYLGEGLKRTRPERKTHEEDLDADDDLVDIEGQGSESQSCWLFEKDDMLGSSLYKLYTDSSVIIIIKGRDGFVLTERP